MRSRYLPFTALLLVVIPGTALADDDDSSATSPPNGYTYCDAKLLSSLWATSVSESKAVMGRKIRSGNRPTLESNLNRARDAAAKNPSKRCTFDDSGFSYSDAEKLSKLWKMPVAKAKALVEQKVTAGNTSAVKAQLRQASSNSTADDLRAWGTTGLSYCDAKVLSKYWQVSVSESKVLVGQKVRSSNKPALNSALNRARADADRTPSKRCEFDETGFSYADASKLSKLWKTSVDDAKSRVERKASTGNSSVVRDLLKKR